MWGDRPTPIQEAAKEVYRQEPAVGPTSKKWKFAISFDARREKSCNQGFD